MRFHRKGPLYLIESLLKVLLGFNKNAVNI